MPSWLSQTQAQACGQSNEKQKTFSPNDPLVSWQVPHLIKKGFGNCTHSHEANNIIVRKIQVYIAFHNC